MICHFSWNPQDGPRRRSGGCLSFPSLLLPAVSLRAPWNPCRRLRVTESPWALGREEVLPLLQGKGWAEQDPAPGGRGRTWTQPCGSVGSALQGVIDVKVVKELHHKNLFFLWNRFEGQDELPRPCPYQLTPGLFPGSHIWIPSMLSRCFTRMPTKSPG